MRRALRIGFESARANLVPMVVLWLAAVASVLAYYFVPGAPAVFEPLRRWQLESGWKAAFLSRVFFCGVVPGAFLLAVARIRPKRPLRVAAAQGLWGGVSGVVYDFFYRFQAGLFGNGADFGTLAAKVAVDQFAMTVFVVAPLNVAVFFWIARDFSFGRVRREWPQPFIRKALLPNLVANWCVWIPVSFAIYAFPQPLQIQVSSFACAFWALTCLQIGARTSSAPV